MSVLLCAFRLTLFLSCLAVILPVSADSFRRQVTQAAEKHLIELADAISSEMDAEHFTVKIHPLPDRIKEPPCRAIPTVQSLVGSQTGEQRLKVSCSGEVEWSVYIKGRISVFLPVLISVRSIPKGKVPDETDFTWSDRDVSLLSNGYFTDPALLLTRVARQRIDADKVLTPKMFRARCPVSKLY